MVQWLGLCALAAEGMHLIPGWGASISSAMCHVQKIIIIKLINLLKKKTVRLTDNYLPKIMEAKKNTKG